jgi:cbb3-type cytochrome oxidase subunit 3
MIKKQRLWAKIFLALLTLCGIYSVYWMLGSVWLMGDLRADPSGWRTMAYICLGESILIGFCWIALLVWLLTQPRKSKSEEKGTAQETGGHASPKN